MPIVIICYLLANISYFFVLPSSTIEGTNTVAVQFGSKVFGPVGALVLALVVAGSCFGALNATTFTSGRLVYAAGKEGYLPGIFGNLGVAGREGSSIPMPPSTPRLGGPSRSGRRKWKNLITSSDTPLFYTPVNSFILLFVLTSVYVLIGEFSTLVTFYGVAGYTFYFFTVLGLIVLRVKEPHLERPYKT